jgi:septal ring factor EnvC (AmiA/AmiB activator)
MHSHDGRRPEMTNPAREWLCVIAMVVPLLAVPAGLMAETKDDPRRRLQQLETDIARDREQSEKLKKRAADLGTEVETVRSRAVAAARAAQDSERTLARLEAEIAALNRAETMVANRLNARRAEVGSAVMALQRLALYPPEAMFAQPVPPSDVVRGAILLRAAVTEIERRAVEVRSDLDEVRASKAEAARILARHAQAAAKLAQERRTLDETLARRSALARETSAEAKALERRLAQLAAEARGLNELMERLEVEQARGRGSAAARAAARSGAPGVQLSPSTTPFVRSRGQLPMPAVGQVVLRYGQTAATGLTHKGITLETQAGATVVAPFAGYVVFADEFRGYGQLLILDHGDGYHTLLAGMTRIDGVPGLWVETGEPVGVMGQADKGRPRLYVEIRRGGQPFDPLPWLAASNDKVSG